MERDKSDAFTENIADSEDLVDLSPQPHVKPGVVYLSRIPEKLTVKQARQIFSNYGSIGRIYFEPIKHEEVTADGSVVLRKRRSRGKRKAGFTEGWIEFLDRRHARRAADHLNMQPIAAADPRSLFKSRSKAKWRDELWSIRYLKGFQWTHLHEREAGEKATRKQRITMHVSAAKRLGDHFRLQLERATTIRRVAQRRAARLAASASSAAGPTASPAEQSTAGAAAAGGDASGKQSRFMRQYRQRRTDEQILQSRGASASAASATSSLAVLRNIFT